MTAVVVIIALSAIVPPIIVGVLAWKILRGRKDDPDEQRWRRLEEQRREARARGD